jgi:hypothetical protein
MTGVSVDDVLTYAADFERSYVAVVRGRINLRVGQIVYVAFSREETTMGFGFPKEDREALVASDPERFFMPRPSEMRFNWVETRLDRLDIDEMKEFVLDAWGMVVPKFLFRERLLRMGYTGAVGLPKASPERAASGPGAGRSGGAQPGRGTPRKPGTTERRTGPKDP